MSEKATSLQIPNLTLKFTDNKDGTFSVSLPIPNSGDINQMPLLALARKNAEVLLTQANNTLVARGVDGHFGDVGVNAGGKVTGSRTSGTEVGAEGDVKAVGLNGKLQSGGSVGGEVNNGLTLIYHPGRNGLGAEEQAAMQLAFQKQFLETSLDWANSQRTLAEQKGRPCVVEGVECDATALRALARKCIQGLEPLREAENQRIEDSKGMWQKYKEAWKATLSSNTGDASVDAAQERYAGLFDQSLRGVAALPPIGSPPRSRDELTAMAVDAAIGAGLDPNKSIELHASKDGQRFFVTQGEPGNPGSQRIPVDPAQPPQSPALANVVEPQTQNPAQQRGMG